jgi:hypothetical protein
VNVSRFPHWSAVDCFLGLHSFRCPDHPLGILGKYEGELFHAAERRTQEKQTHVWRDIRHHHLSHLFYLLHRPSHPLGGGMGNSIEQVCLVMAWLSVVSLILSLIFMSLATRRERIADATGAEEVAERWSVIASKLMILAIGSLVCGIFFSAASLTSRYRCL